MPVKGDGGSQFGALWQLGYMMVGVVTGKPSIDPPFGRLVTSPG